jgi:Zn-finger in ubiquitin-hydrolases and other protein
MACHHFDHINLKALPTASASYAKGCPECIEMGDTWVHLRECLVCGHVGCCDSSKNKHATKHFHTSEHPVMRSVEPGERWGWCYVDEAMAQMP